VRFWGVRGSLPSPGPTTLRYGGNTTCIEVRTGGELIVIDAGSGIRFLGQALVAEHAGAPIQLTLLHSHAHWDHIQGFPFFAPAYVPGTRIRIVGGHPSAADLRRVFADQMDGQRWFPVAFDRLAATITFDHLDLEGDLRFRIGDVGVTACPTNHPGGSLGFRIETPEGAIVFLSDHETAGPDEPRIREFIAGAALLIADAQYDAAEIVTRRGWGHGCVDEVLSLAASVGIGRVILFHHDPSHDDDFLDRLVGEARARAGRHQPGMIVEAAREGDVIRL
jgi:phosphoribosyl 1,2-cyclic phosphodiesterase